jgi:hypothetical protein
MAAYSNLQSGWLACAVERWREIVHEKLPESTYDTIELRGEVVIFAAYSENKMIVHAEFAPDIKKEN